MTYDVKRKPSRRIEIMKYLMILTIGVCLLFASVPVMADQTGNVKVAFIERAKKYISFSSVHEPKKGRDVLIVMRIEGTTIENVQSEQSPYVEFNGVKRKASMVQTSDEAAIEKGGEMIIIAPWILLAFPVPETTTELKLVIDNCPPVTISAPTKVLEKLSHSDVN
jgi:hypothetical protein